MIHVFSISLSPRLEYILAFLIKDFFGSDFELYTDLSEFEMLEGPKISYGKRAERSIYIPSQGLLFENGIHPQTIEIDGGPKKEFFKVDGEGFDVLSACFYLLSRYEEYLPSKRDKYGRFSSEDSILGKHDLLDRPLVDEYAIDLKTEIESKFGCQLKERNYTFLPTYDIDIAFAYKGRGIWRTAGGIGRSLIHGDFKSISKRVAAITDVESDPFDTFALLDEINKENDLKPIYFFHVGEYAFLDKNVSVKYEPYRSLIENLSKKYEIALHPSYQSNADIGKLVSEKEKLETITGKQVFKSRQHFLMLELPKTYRLLLKLGIRSDYSMAFPDRPGFRAGTCTPFKFYDLELEEETKLTIYPFQLMDTTFPSYMKVDFNRAVEISKRIIDSVRSVEGTFVSLWHNNSLSNHEEWKGWQSFYEEVVKYAKQEYD
ncbi:MAG: hypothetical protein HKN92_02810 [Chitinophagales bacterium]|nr:hypothetical protein [Chitinophagales bacterium]